MTYATQDWARVTFPSYAALRWRGRGTSFADVTDPTAGDWFFRTDLLLECVYDGTRWLTFNEYAVPFRAAGGNTTTAVASLISLVQRADYAPYVTHVAVMTNVAMTNNTTNYWDLLVRGVNSTFSVASTIHTITTRNDAAGVAVHRSTAANGTAAPTNYAYLDIATAKTGAPGALTWDVTAYYRLIIT